MEKRSGRLLSLDALRGFDMFFIMGGEAVLRGGRCCFLHCSICLSMYCNGVGGLFSLR